MKINQNTIKHANEKACCEDRKAGYYINNPWEVLSQWILILSAIVITGLFILGLLLDPNVIRILWLTLFGLLLVVVLPILVFFGRWTSQRGEEYITKTEVESETENHENI